MGFRLLLGQNIPGSPVHQVILSTHGDEAVVCMLNTECTCHKYKVSKQLTKSVGSAAKYFNENNS